MIQSLGNTGKYWICNGLNKKDYTQINLSETNEVRLIIQNLSQIQIPVENLTCDKHILSMNHVCVHSLV